VEVVYPKTGSALAFDHYLYHEGSEVISGVKYAIRSDVFFISMYEKERIETAQEYFTHNLSASPNNFLDLYQWVYSHLRATNTTVKFTTAKSLWQVIFNNSSQFLSFLDSEGIEAKFPSISADTWLQVYNFLKKPIYDSSWPLFVDEFISYIDK